MKEAKVESDSSEEEEVQDVMEIVKQEPWKPEAIIDEKKERGEMPRYLVKWEGRPKSDNSWTKHHWFRSTGNEDVFEELYAKFDLESKTAFNMQLEPILHNPNLRINESDASGVVALSVSAEDARRCADHLKAEWKNGKLKMSDKSVARGYKTYGKTLLEQNAEEQGLNTLLITQQLLPAVRQNVPGFHAMEKQLASWLQAKFGTVVELYYAHGLRQGPLTLRSSGFSVHQDTEDYDFIEYTIVVKLTADEPGEAPSAMRVVGADRHFHYGAKHGDAGLLPRAALPRVGRAQVGA